ncbi:MAG TPA: AMP-binding protein [Candidatus Eisenbacteria bacterium]|nr:AMP-binding protein [Candidatus Eisenbacteria bacterium]
MAAASFATLHELVAFLASHGDKTALVAFTKKGPETYSYRQLTERAQQLARGLTKTGLEPGSRMLIFAPNRAEWVVACLALLAFPAVPVPVDVQIGQEELEHILGETEARYVFTTTTLARRLEKAGHRLEPILLDREADEPGGWGRYLVDAGDRLPAPSPEDHAILFYTSGTSGRPKGVPLTHKNITSNLNALLSLELIRSEYRVLLPLPLHHAYPFTVGMLAPLAAGVPLILPSAMTANEFRRALQEGDATAVIGVPRLYRALYEAIESSLKKRGRLVSALFHGVLAVSVALRKRGLRAGDYVFYPIRKQIAPRLQVLASGGSALEPELAWKLEGLGWQLASGYGLTETSPVLTFNIPGKERVGTTGRALPGVDLRISRPQAGREFGEVLARGPNVFSGYWRMPDKNAEVFTTDGYFHTGDLGYLDEENYLHLVGRASEMIVLSAGENIQPENVEAVLERSPYIREVGVLARRDRLVALVVPEPEARRQAEPVEDLIRREIQRESNNLPSHHRITDYAITEEPLPRTRIGKLRRHMLPERFERAKYGEDKQPPAGPVPLEQMTPDDQELLEDPRARIIWDWLITRFPDARLAPESNFQLDLGIDSLDWLNLTLEIRALTGAELDEAAINRSETVRDLLREVATAAQAAPLEKTGDPTEMLRQPEHLLSEKQRRWLEPPSPAVRFLGSSLLVLNRFLMRGAFRLKIRGRPPERRPFIMTPNHASFLDPLAIGAALPKQELDRTYWGGWTGIMFANPLMRILSRAVRVIPIDPQGGRLSSIAFAVAALKQGYNLVWFPEGGRSPDGKLRRFRPGIGLIASTEPVSLIPVWVEGTYDALPVGRRFPRLRPISVTFGQPSTATELAPESLKNRSYQEFADALHERVAALGRAPAAGGEKTPQP